MIIPIAILAASIAGSGLAIALVSMGKPDEDFTDDIHHVERKFIERERSRVQRLQDAGAL